MKKVAQTNQVAGIDLTPEQIKQLDALDGNPDLIDIPEAPQVNWSTARQFFKPRKEPISLRIDADVLDWLRLRNDHYQTEINRILRATMEAEPRVK